MSSGFLVAIDKGLLRTSEWPPRSGYDRFPMPEKTCQQSRLHREGNLPVQSMLIFDASTAVTKGMVQRFPGPPWPWPTVALHWKRDHKEAGGGLSYSPV